MAFVLVLFTFLAVVKTVFVSIDIDESYAVTQSFRLVQGDLLLQDMWEPHQFSAYLSALLIKPYIFFFHSTEGIVLFLRICGSILHLMLGIALYFTFHRFTSGRMSLLLCIVHMNFLPKWIQTPEFELMHYWLLAITFVAFVRFYLCSFKKIWLIISGLCMMLQLLNYPTMILLYPFYVAGMFSLSGNRMSCGHKKHSSDGKNWPVRDAAIMTLGAVIPGIGFLLYLFSYMTPEELLSNLLHVLADPSHTGNSFSLRLTVFGLEFLQDLLMLAALYAVCILLVYGVRRLTGHRMNLFLSAGLIETVLLCICQAFGCLFFDKNQFFLQNRYLFILFFALFLYFSKKERTPQKKLLFWFALVPSIFSTFAVVLLTNMSVNVSYSKLFLCVPVLFLYLADERTEKTENWYDYLAPLALAGSLLVCRLILIRVTGCLPVTIKANMARMENGPLKNIYVTSDLCQSLTSDGDILAEYVSEDDSLFYFGCESLLYLVPQADISVASVQGTSVFNQDFLDYLELHPDKFPSVIAVDKTFTMIDAYHYNPYNYIVADWISEVCADAETMETEYITLYFLPKTKNLYQPLVSDIKK